MLIAGCGYVGSALAHELAGEGRTVWGLRRSPEGLPEGVLPVAADLSRPHTLDGLPRAVDAVVYCASADTSSEEAYRTAYVEGPRNLLDALGRRGAAPRRLLFVSSTAVYGQEGGSWVDEDSPTRPTDFRGRVLLEAEALVGAWEATGIVVRFGGIYGPGRTRLVERVRSGEARCARGEPRYSNRIHRDDCAGVLRHLLDRPDPRGLYLGVDREPAERCEVLRWLARRLGVPDPPVVEGEREGRRRSNKRCSSDRLVAEGYRFRHPTYREGYGDLLAEEGAGPLP